MLQNWVQSAAAGRRRCCSAVKSGDCRGQRMEMELACCCSRPGRQVLGWAPSTRRTPDDPCLASACSGSHRATDSLRACTTLCHQICPSLSIVCLPHIAAISIRYYISFSTSTQHGPFQTTSSTSLTITPPRCCTRPNPLLVANRHRQLAWHPAHLRLAGRQPQSDRAAHAKIKQIHSNIHVPPVLPKRASSLLSSARGFC